MKIPQRGSPPLVPTAGGIVPAGSPMAQGATSLSPGAMQAEFEAFIEQHPQVVSQIKAAVDEAVASGELTQEELAVVTQMTAAVLENPADYPKLRAFAIEQNLVDPADLPQRFDPGLMFVLLAVLTAAGGGSAAQQGTPGLRI